MGEAWFVLRKWGDGRRVRSETGPGSRGKQKGCSWSPEL